MCRVGAGTRRRADAVAVEADATLNAPQYFAPGHENCEITYTYWRRGRMQGAQVSLEIKDKDNNRIYYSRALTLRDRPNAERPGRHVWNGRNDANEIIAKPQNGPYKVILKVGNAITREKTVKVQVDALYLWVRPMSGVRNSILVNEGGGKVDVIASVMVRSSNGTRRRIKTPIDVKYSFTAGGANIRANQSYAYSGANRLGKRGNADAVFWEAHPHSTASSDDHWKQTCKARTVVNNRARYGKSYVRFKPSGYGGDHFRVKAEIIATESGRTDRRGRAQKIERQTAMLTVWRRVRMRGYEMPRYRHITNHGRPGSMNPYYTNNNTFVKYELRGGITRLTNARYIGLWDHDTSSYKTWGTWKRKLSTADAATNETPTAADITAAADGSAATGPQRTAARNRIRRCANNWKNRIYNAYSAAMRHWVTDQRIPAGSLIGLGYEHPKISHNAPRRDAITSEWSGMDWLTVEVEHMNRHPDLIWIRSMGLSSNRRAFIFYDSDATELEKTVVHEVGHETKNHFPRALFRPASSGGRPEDSDHTTGVGMMDPSGSGDNFTNGEKRILRGRDNP